MQRFMKRIALLLAAVLTLEAMAPTNTMYAETLQSEYQTAEKEQEESAVDVSDDEIETETPEEEQELVTPSEDEIEEKTEEVISPVEPETVSEDEVFVDAVSQNAVSANEFVVVSENSLMVAQADLSDKIIY